MERYILIEYDKRHLSFRVRSFDSLIDARTTMMIRFGLIRENLTMELDGLKPFDEDDLQETRAFLGVRGSRTKRWTWVIIPSELDVPDSDGEPTKELILAASYTYLKELGDKLMFQVSHDGDSIVVLNPDVDLSDESDVQETEKQLRLAIEPVRKNFRKPDGMKNGLYPVDITKVGMSVTLSF